MNLRNFRIGTRLTVGFGMVICVLVAALLGTVGLSRWVSTSTAATFEQALAKERSSVVMQMALLEGAVYSRNAIIEPDIVTRQKQADLARASAKRFSEEQARFTALGTDETESRILTDIETLGKKVDTAFKQAVALAQSMEQETAAQMIGEKVDPEQRKQIDLIRKLGDIQLARYKEAQANADALSVKLLAGVVLVVLLAVCGGAIIGLLCTRSIVRPLAEAVRVTRQVKDGDLTMEIPVSGKDETAQLLGAMNDMTHNLRTLVSQVRGSSDSISTGSSEIASGSMDLSQRTEETAGNLQQTASSMSRLTLGVRQTAESAAEANQLATQATGVAGRGGQVVEQVVSSMQSIAQSSSKIAEIIGVIDGIAFQTNILALNAAVEAARAGEQGRGFAVVAGEVRSLAQRSAAAAKEIKALIQASVETVDQGSGYVAQASKAMSEIVSNVRRVGTLISEISQTSQAQSAELAEVSDAVTQLDSVTQQNAALVEQSAAAAESLQHQAANLTQLVSVFRVESAAGGMA